MYALRGCLEHSRTAETSAQKCSKPDINLKISKILWGGAQPIPRPSPDQGVKPFFVSRRTSCYGRRTTCSVREDKLSLNSIFADYSGDWFILFVGDDGVAECISNLKKQSCTRYSKKSKFRPKMRQNAFGGRAPPGPAGGA